MAHQPRPRVLPPVRRMARGFLSTSNGRTSSPVQPYQHDETDEEGKVGRWKVESTSPSHSSLEAYSKLLPISQLQKSLIIRRIGESVSLFRGRRSREPYSFSQKMSRLSGRSTQKLSTTQKKARKPITLSPMQAPQRLPCKSEATSQPASQQASKQGRSEIGAAPSGKT